MHSAFLKRRNDLLPPDAIARGVADLQRLAFHFTFAFKSQFDDPGYSQKFNLNTTPGLLFDHGELRTEV